MINKKQQAVLQKELDALNVEWNDVTARRKEWMDAHMADFAEYAIGKPFVDSDTGEYVGKVTKHYRFHRDDPRFDDSMDIDHEFSRGDNCYDNTSRQPFRIISEKEYRRNRRDEVKSFRE